MADDDAPWYRPLVTGVGALFGVALLVGGIISLVALGAVNISGLGDSGSARQAEPSLYIPERNGSPSGGGDEDAVTLDDLNPGRSPSGSPSPSADDPTPAKKEPSKPARKSRKPQRSVISLSASPLSVSSMERIYLTGTYPGGEGANLQVQRLEGSWRNFPTSTSVSGGTFSTYVMTGQSGPNKFRVVDTGSGKKSNVVTVRVR